MENSRAAGGKGVGFIVAEFVKKPRFGGFVRISGVDAIDVGPDDEFIGVDDVRNDGAGEIGTVAAESGDAAIGSSADETSDDRDDAGVEKREKNVAAAVFSLFEVWLGFTESVAGQNEFRGCHGHGRDARLFDGGGEEPGAEAFAKRGQAIEEIRAGEDAGVNGYFVEKIASQELQLAADAKVIAFPEAQILKHIEMKIEDELGFAASVRKFAIGKSTGNREKVIGDALHSGNNDGDVR